MCVRGGKRLDLAVMHSDEDTVFEPLDGGIWIPENVLRPSKGPLYLGVSFKGLSPRRASGRITTAGAGYSYCGIALRSDKAGEGSGRGRKATGQVRRGEAVSAWKAQPSFGMAELSLRISSVSQKQGLKPNLYRVLG